KRAAQPDQAGRPSGHEWRRLLACCYAVVVLALQPCRPARDRARAEHFLQPPYSTSDRQLLLLKPGNASHRSLQCTYWRHDVLELRRFDRHRDRVSATLRPTVLAQRTGVPSLLVQRARLNIQLAYSCSEYLLHPSTSVNDQ